MLIYDLNLSYFKIIEPKEKTSLEIPEEYFRMKSVQIKNPTLISGVI